MERLDNTVLKCFYESFSVIIILTDVFGGATAIFGGETAVFLNVVTFLILELEKR